MNSSRRHGRRVRTPSSSRWRRATTLTAASALISFGLVGTSGPAFAVHAQDMQLDGNTSAAGIADPAYDWESMFQGDGGPTGDIKPKSALPTADFLASGSKADYVLPEYSTFATGSKDTLDLNGWQCGKSNNLGAKDDLVNVYTAAYRNPANQHLILYFGAEKSSNLGDNNIGIWFLQDKNAGCTVPASGKNTTFNGLHQEGDVLLTAAFTNGGTQATVESHAWTSAGLGAADSGFLCTAPTAAQLAAPSADTSACAITNLSEFSPPWAHPLKTPGTNGALAPQEFYEGGVDVTQLEIDSKSTNTDPCISTFVADTRSSQSPTATLFDYAAGSIPVCHPATTLSVTRSPATIHSGDTVTWTAHELNSGTSPLTSVTVTDAAMTGACYPFASTLGDGSTSADGTHNIGDLNNNGKLDPAAGTAAAESWTFTCSQALTASRTINIYGSGVDTLPNPDQTVAGGPASACTFDDTKSPPTVTFQAANYVCDPNERASASVTVINPNTSLQTTAAPATATPATIHSGESSTLAFYEKNTGNTVLTNVHVDTDLTGSTCATTTRVTGTAGGDTGNDGVFSPGETWKFTCSTTFATSTTVTAVGHGTDPLGADVTTPAYPSETTTVTVTVINPDTSLTTTASAVITYSFAESNTGDTAISSPHVSVAAGTCDASPAYVSGDSNANGLLDLTETWVFTCTHTLTGPTTDTGTTSTYVNAHGHGFDTTGADVTKCPSDETTSPQPACRNSGSEADRTDVTITNSARN